jgi:putative aldouronate transport system substrate-binding protein
LSGEQITELTKNNNWGFWYAYAGGGLTENYEATGYNAVLPIDVVPMNPIVVEGKKPYIECAYVSDIPSWLWIVSSKTKYPELCVSYLDTLLSEPVATSFQGGIEGESYEIDSSGQKQWKPEFLAKGSDAKLEMGIWNILGPRYNTMRDDISNLRALDKLSIEALRLNTDLLLSGKAESDYRRGTPMFTDEENEEKSAIMTYVDTMIGENEQKFVLGQRPLSEWDTYIDEVKSAGDIERVLEIYSNAKQAPDRPQTNERNYLRP